MPTPRSLTLAATLILSATLMACASGPRDLRPAAVLDGITQEEAQKGRALLDRAAQNAGGKELLLRHPGFVTELNDVWTNWMGKMLFLRYEPEQRIRVEARGSRVDDVAMTLVGGERDGEVWGLENNRVYVQPKGEQRTFTDDEITMLYVKNPPAIVLLPLRLAYADKVAYAGPVEFEGKTYEQVFVTWSSLEPNTKFDQWVVWIDPDSGNIAKAKCTVREYTGLGPDEAVVELEDYKSFGDVMVPTTIKALFALEDSDPIRTWTIESFAWTDEAHSGR